MRTLHEDLCIFRNCSHIEAFSLDVYHSFSHSLYLCYNK